MDTRPIGMFDSGIGGLTVLKEVKRLLEENPPQFDISAKCCDYCKKQPAHEVQKGYSMIITGERKAEGGC